MKSSAVACFLCGGPATLYAGTAAELRIDCPACLEYAITGGAASALKNNLVAAAIASALVKARHAAGESRPTITSEMLAR